MPWHWESNHCRAAAVCVGIIFGYIRHDRWIDCHDLVLTHWGWVMYVCVRKLTIIGSDSGLLPGRHQAIIWTNAGILLIGPSATNFSEILIKIHTFSFKKTISSGKWGPFCLSLNELTYQQLEMHLCVLSTVATDALVLKLQAISNHSAD